ncbi:MAG: hypothetical protein NT018_02245 [Armatimonadetes bacterium]|nr:hypothetical protein [Armatimonadota bacterium]
MRTILIGMALLCVLSVAAMATQIDVYVPAGWNSVSIPVVPFNPEVRNVFPLDYEAAAQLQNSNQDYYDVWADPPNPFGGILLGEGYLAYSEVPVTSSFFDGVGDVATCLEDGVPDAGVKTDMWISLPVAGWNLFGVPYNTAVAIDQDTGAPIWFTDGTDVLSWPDAMLPANGWLSSDSMQYMTAGAWSYAGINWGYEYQLTPGVGYWIYTNVPNLAMIISPAP